MLYQKTLASEKTFIHSAFKNYVKKNKAFSFFFFFFFSPQKREHRELAKKQQCNGDDF